MYKRLIYKTLSLFLLVAYLVGFAYLGDQKFRSIDDEARLVGALQSLPDRFHQPMSFYELQHLKNGVRGLVLPEQSALDPYEASRTDLALMFDLDDFNRLVDDNRLREARTRLVSLSVKALEQHDRNRSTLLIALFAGLVGCFLLSSLVIYCFGRANALFVNEKLASIDDAPPSSALGVAIQNVCQLESVKSGHDYVLEIKNDDAISVTDPKYPLVEAVICELASNAIMHGGRAAAIRQAANKPSTLKVFVGIEKSDDHWTVTVADDGEGIDEIQTMKHAISKSLVSDETIGGIKQGHGVKLVLLEGYSDAPENKAGALQSNCLAGIRVAVQNIGGTIALRNRPSVFCEFKITVPV